MYLPDSILRFLPKQKCTVDQLGCSEATVLMFEDRILKIQKECNVSANEYYMMKWLQGRVNVPEIIAAEQLDGVRYLLMSRVNGHNLCEVSILDDQIRLAELMAQGLENLWRVDICDCPTRRTLDDKFREIEDGLRGGWITRDQAMQPETYGPGGFESPQKLFDWLISHRPQEELVLSHGDYCLPNIFANDHGISGFIDLGLAGVADKWVDIEKGLWSMWANTTGFFGGKRRKFERQLLFDALEMKPDEDKLRYYGLLEELC